MSQFKADYQKIIDKIETLKSEKWLSESQQWWPDNLFHFTDIINAEKILSFGKLLARSNITSDEDYYDIASSDVISGTDDKWKNYVRLYFRPRTPTLYSNEGFRPTDKLQLNSHCPVPIYFIFNSKEIIAMHNSQFSNGNLGAAGVSVGNDFTFFDMLPFNKIYHDASLFNYSETDKRNIIFHRHAEVIIPNELPLVKNLKFIACRSEAEFETLKYLLPKVILSKYSDKIKIAAKAVLFFSKWSFIEKVNITADEIVFLFNPSAVFKGPYKASFIVFDRNKNKKYSWYDENYYHEKTLSFDISFLKSQRNCEISFLLNDHVAYKNEIIDNQDDLF